MGNLPDCSVQECHAHFFLHNVGHEVLRLSRFDEVADLAIPDRELLLVVDPLIEVADYVSLVGITESGDSVTLSFLLERVSEACIEVELIGTASTVLLMDDIAEIDFRMSLHGIDQLIAVIIELFASSATEVVLPCVARLSFSWHVDDAAH